MNAKDLLTPVTIPEGEPALVGVDLSTRFAHFAGPKGPERIDSQFRKIVVPVFDWQLDGVDEREKIIETLFEASAGNPINLPTYAALNSHFWLRYPNVRGLLLHPDVRVRVVVPDDTEVLCSNNLPTNRLTLVNLPQDVGFYVQQGSKRGVLTNHSRGLLQVQFQVSL